jgi:macrolide transport system ATP-binding/permease protein
MDSIWKDIRFAVRVLAKSPGFTAVVVLSLALGIGANTAIFKIVYDFLLRPMPVEQPDRLAAIYTTTATGMENMSYLDLRDLQKQDTGVADLVGFNGWTVNVTGGEKPEVIWSEIVTGNYFSGLGIHPVVGRGFLPEEDRAPGERPVCVLAYKFWQSHYNGDPGVAGKTIKINNRAFTIVGVAPKGFIGARTFSFIPDLWIPTMMWQTVFSLGGDFLDPKSRVDRDLTPWARLKPGVSLRQAETALNAAEHQLMRQYPEIDPHLTIHLVPGGARTHAMFVADGRLGTITTIMSAAVILVLLIACSNVANLMLARAASRSREMAIRVAVGATRARLVRQLITESVLLSLAGGAVGLLLALWVSDRSVAFYPTLDFQTADMESASRLDPQVFAFAVLVSLVAAVIFGLAPALRASRIDQASAMKAAGGSVTFGRRRIGSGNVLVMAQVAFSCLLLVVGGLFLRSLQFARNVDAGFDRTGISMFSMNLEAQGYDKPRALVFEKNLTERLRNVGMIESAAVASALPLDAYDSAVSVIPDGYVPQSKNEDNAAGLTRVGPRYFETMGTKIIAGRAIDERDTAETHRVAVVNETLSRRYWKSPELALGRVFRMESGGVPLEVIGVARNGKYRSFGENATPYVFYPITQSYIGRMEVLVRSKMALEPLMNEVRRQVAAMDPSLPIYGVRTMPEFLNRTVSIYDMGASLIGTFAVTAMLLAAVGIYGVLHFTVSRRTREIGIRMALGASVGQVLRPVMQRSLLWVTAGLALGAGLAMSARGLTQQMVAGVSGVDPLTFLSVLGGFGLIVVVAAVVPARRAARVDPIRALRQE